MSFKQWFTQEYDKDLEGRVKDALQLSMTDSERARAREFLTHYMRMHPVRVRVQKKQAWFSWSLHPYPMIAGLLIITLGGSTAGAASLAQNALPGDFLYPVKVNVNEEIRVALATTPEKKASVALVRAEERIKELEELEARGADEMLIQSSEESVDEQVRVAEEKSLETGDENGERGKREQRLVAILRAHEHIINKHQESIGGSLTQDVSLEEVIAATAVAPEVASAPAPETVSMAMTATDVVEQSAAKVSARMAAPMPIEDTVVQNVQKKSAAAPSKTLARQKKAAEQRVDALQKLIKKLEKRGDVEALAQAQLSLESAQQFITDSETALDSENETEASFLLNKALTTAIDAREGLSKKERLDDSRDRSGRDSSREGNNRDRDD